LGGQGKGGAQNQMETSLFKLQAQRLVFFAIIAILIQDGGKTDNGNQYDRKNYGSKT